MQLRLDGMVLADEAPVVWLGGGLILGGDMSQWIEISTINALADGAYERFEFDDVDVLVFREGDHVFAIEDLCTHDGAELCGGLYMNGEIECPRHGARFCVKTGQALSAPAYGQVSTFPIRINDDGVIELQFEDA